MLKRVAGHRFYNTAPWTFATLLNDDKNLADNLATYRLPRVAAWKAWGTAPRAPDRAG